jgi:regulator of replication initiation timing
VGVDVSGITQAVSQIESVQKRVDELGRAAQTAAGQASGLTERFSAAVPELRRLNVEMEALKSQLQSGAIELDRLSKSAFELAPSSEAATRSLTTLRSEGEALQARLSAVGVDAKVLAEQFNDIPPTMNEITAQSLRMRLAQQQLSGELRKDEKVVKEVADSVQRYTVIQHQEIAAAERAVEAHTKLNRVKLQQVRTDRQLEQTGKRTVQLLDQVEGGARTGGRGRHAAARGGDIGGLNRTELTSIISVLTSGRIGATAMSMALFRLGDGFGKVLSAARAFLPVLIAIGAPLLAVKAAFSIMNSDIGKTAEALGVLNPQLRQTVENVASLKGFNLKDTLGLLPAAANRLTSFGANNGRLMAEQIARLAEPLQFLMPGQGDAGTAFTAIQRAVESMNFDSLRDAGFNVDELNNKLKQMADQGIGESTRRAFILQTVMEQIRGRGGEAADQARREFNTMADVMAQIQGIWDAISKDERLAQAGQAFVAALRDAIPFLVSVASLIATIFTNILRMAAETKTLFTDPAGVNRRTLTEELPTARHLSLAERQRLARQKKIGAEFEVEPLEGFESNFEDAMDAINESLETFNTKGDIAASTAETLQSALAARSTGFGLVGQVKGLSQAIFNLNQEASVSNALDSLQAYEAVLATVVEKGPNQLRLLRLQAEAMFKGGFFDEEEFAALTAGLDHVEAVTRPMEAEARKIRESMGGQATAAGNTASNIATASSNMSGLAGETANATGVMYGLADAAGSVASAIAGFGSFRGAAGRGRGSVPGGGPRGPGGANVRFGPGSVGESADVEGRLNWATRDRERRAAESALETQRNVLNENVFGFGAGGGGGGGGGAQDMKASIEEIRQLFRNIGQLIKIGTNNGVFFSPAGNTIPLGGPNEFLNTKGGTLIQTVNIRGIWDFADPAAKRQILKELEEAIAGLKKEIA